MGENRVKRRISAILSADVAKYGLLMGDDEAATVQTLESYRETMSSLIGDYNGRVVDSPGDNILSEFPSVVDAVQCAVEIQKVIKTKNADLPDARKMAFRIGINLGDVIEEGERIYGDGVNIAARIEALADPGGICISGSAYDQIETKLALGYRSMGSRRLKHVKRPVHIYKIPTEPGEETDPEKDLQPEDVPTDMPVTSKAGNPNDYYLSGFICLAVALGLPVLGYFIGQIEPEAFYPLVGAGAMLVVIGIALILAGKLFFGRR